MYLSGRRMCDQPGRRRDGVLCHHQRCCQCARGLQGRGSARPRRLFRRERLAPGRGSKRDDQGHHAGLCDQDIQGGLPQTRPPREARVPAPRRRRRRRRRGGGEAGVAEDTGGEEGHGGRHPRELEPQDHGRVVTAAGRRFDLHRLERGGGGRCGVDQAGRSGCELLLHRPGWELRGSGLRGEQERRTGLRLCRHRVQRRQFW
mmetsp:Transcript_32903/g.94667  ORF Transcript_32903/g.94667 Transcript_32903/m.94667 type:complete len:203 (-) Transcript_32903:938-1546(-)